MALAEQMNQWLRGLFGSYNDSSNDVQTMVRRMYRASTKYTKAADANAVVNTAATYFFRTNSDIQIRACHFVPNGTGALNNTNYATINLLSAAGAGGATTVAANVATTATNIAAGVPYALTIQSANVDAGGVLAISITKSGAGGLLVPQGELVVEYEQR